MKLLKKNLKTALDQARARSEAAKSGTRDLPSISNESLQYIGAAIVLKILDLIKDQPQDQDYNVSNWLGSYERVILTAPWDTSSYILIDFDSGRILEEKGADEKRDIASLTKIMTSYVAFDNIKKGNVNLTDKVLISEKSWRKDGSRMFVEEGKKITLLDLIKGMVITNANDAACAIAEHVGVNEEGFVELMQQKVMELGMNNTQFKNIAGQPDEKHYSSARDLALLTKKLIDKFPDYYKFYKEKEFTFNDIRQLNRNSLLSRDDSFDGVTTGYTDIGGYCLVSSAERYGQRLISVTLGGSSIQSRAEDAQKLLSYGFRHAIKEK